MPGRPPDPRTLAGGRKLTALIQPFTLSRSVKGNDLMRKRHHRAVKSSGRSILFVLICIFGSASTQIAAQEPLASGSRVRVTAPDCALRGQAATLQAIRADTLVLETTECPMASVTRLDVSRGQKSHALLGAGIGFTAVALGVVIYCKTAEFSGCVPYDSDLTLAFALIYGGVGGVAGGLVGYLIKTERWEEIPLERLRLGLAPQRDGGFALGFSVRF